MKLLKSMKQKANHHKRLVNLTAIKESLVFFFLETNK